MSPSSTSSSDAPPVGYDDRDLVPLCDAVFATPARRLISIGTLAFFLTIVFGGSVIDLVWPRPLPKLAGAERDEEEKSRQRAKFKDGSLARRFERDLRTRSTLRYAALPYYAGALAHWFSEADPATVVIGKNGWMFVVQRLNAIDAPRERLVDLPAALLAAAAKRLRLLGTELVVLPLPRKAEIYTDRLRRNVYRIRPDLLPRLVAACRHRGVNVVDLAPIWLAHQGVPVYCRTDTHWSPDGAVLAAEATAAAAGILEAPDDRSTKLIPKSREIYGDLLRLAGILRPDGSGLTGMKESLPHYFPIARLDGSPRAFKSATRTTDCAIVGTSFSAEIDQFPTYLWHVTDRDWWFGAMRATGPIQPMRRAFGEFGKTGFPRVLVWEIPAHYFFSMRAGLDGLAELLAELPTTGLVRLDDSEGGPAQPFLSESGKLQLGVVQVGKESVAGHSDIGRLVNPADGTFSIRFTAEVEGSEIVLAVNTPSFRVSVVLQPGSHDVAVPIVGEGPSARTGYGIRTPSGTATVTIKDLSVVSALRPGPALATRIQAPRALASGWEQDIDVGGVNGEGPKASKTLRIELAPLPEAAYPVTISFVSDAGAPAVPAVSIAQGRTRHSVFVPVPVGLVWSKIRVGSATGKPPGQAATSVALYSQLERR